jgi:hypothetical protein
MRTEARGKRHEGILVLKRQEQETSAKRQETRPKTTQQHKKQ